MPVRRTIFNIGVQLYSRASIKLGKTLSSNFTASCLSRVIAHRFHSNAIHCKIPSITTKNMQTPTQVKCFFDSNATNTCQYIVWDKDTSKAAIIDPVMDFSLINGNVTFEHADELLAFVKSNNLDVIYILETHAHADHLTSSQYLKKRLASHPPVCIGVGITQVQTTFKEFYNLDNSFATDGSQFDYLIKDKESLALGSLNIVALHTPGHTPDHTAYQIGDAVFIGDSLFMPDLGTARCDFPGGSAEQLYNSIQERYWTLPPSTRVFIGHDYPNGREASWETTIKEQQSANKHVNLSVEKSQFVQMRTTRDATLSTPKLLHFSLQVNMRAGKFEAVAGSNQTLMVRYPLRVPVGSL
ncbi:hypothetical protein RTP6_002582 [Batrachochytrium dendrobatidis]